MNRRTDVFSLLIGLAFAVVGLLFLLDASGSLDVDPSLVWPLVLIAGGAGAAANSFRRQKNPDDPDNPD